MFKSLVFMFCVAAASAALFGPAIHSGSSNSAMNLMSSGSNIQQSDVQNVQSAAGYGGYGYNYGYPVYPQVGAVYPQVGAVYPGYPYGYELGYGYHGLNGLPYSGYGNVYSGSSNVASNVMSTDSNVHQSHVQNVDGRW